MSKRQVRPLVVFAAILIAVAGGLFINFNFVSPQMRHMREVDTYRETVAPQLEALRATRPNLASLEFRTGTRHDGSLLIAAQVVEDDDLAAIQGFLAANPPPRPYEIRSMSPGRIVFDSVYGSR